MLRSGLVSIFVVVVLVSLLSKSEHEGEVECVEDRRIRAGKGQIEEDSRERKKNPSKGLQQEGHAVFTVRTTINAAAHPCCARFPHPAFCVSILRWLSVTSECVLGLLRAWCPFGKLTASRFPSVCVCVCVLCAFVGRNAEKVFLNN